MRSLALVVSLALVAGCDSENELDVGPADAAVGKPSLVIDPPSFGFGSVATGTVSPAQTFTVTNNGSGPSGTLQINVGAPFTRDTGTCTGPLQAHESCSFLVSFMPTQLGSASGTVTVSGGPGSVVTADVRGVGVSPDQVALDFGAHDFGTLVVGAPNPTFTFTVRNHSPVTTGTIAVKIVGSAASAMSYTTACTTLAPGASCTVAVTLATTTAGSQSGVLEVRASPGGVATALLFAQLLSPAAISVTADPSAPFGDVVVNGTADRTFVVGNSGTQPSGALAISVGSGDFSVLTGSAGDCVSGTTSLSVGQTCNVRVRFQPTATGARTATLGVTASPGGSAEAALAGTGLAPGQLASATATHDFGIVEVQFQSTSSQTWTVSNSGQVATGTPSLTNNNSSEVIVVNNGCTAPLAPGATCSITTKFRPSGGGARTGNLTLSAFPGGSVGLALSAEGRWRLTVTSTGTGTVTATGINCGTGGSDCTELIAHNSVVTLNARTTNGSGSHFSRWTGACAGIVFDCTVTMTSPQVANASFAEVTSNLAFVSSAKFPADLGGVAAYDNQCNVLASAAGINNVDGTAFKAWISDSTSNAVTRLGATTGGWRMLDGRIFARSMDDLIQNRVLHPLAITEQGARQTGFVWTSTNTDGTLGSDHCANWTDTAGASVRTGYASGGPGEWTAAAFLSCTSNRHVYCLQTTSSTPIASSFPPPDAKIIYYTDGFTPGGGVGSADAYCNAHKPPIYAARTFRALAATSTQRIANITTPSSRYYRPDGTFVGTATELNAGALSSGIWQRDDGTYPIAVVRAWSGSTAPTSFGSVTTSCNNWTYNDPGATGREGLVNRMDGTSWWASGAAIPCNSTRALYCIEQ